MRWYGWLVLTVLLVLLLAGVALAQTGGGYDLSWFKVAAGGGTGEGGGYTLAGTIGQAEASTMSGGGYTLTGGFWAGIMEWFRLHLPAVFKAQ